MNKLILSFIAVIFSFGVQAQNWSWTAANGPYGAPVSDMVVTSNGTFLVASNAGLFRSTDSGATWSRVTVVAQNSLFSDLEVASSGTIYLTTTFKSPSVNGLYSSTDNGATWSNVAGAGLPTGSLKKVKATASGKLYFLYASSTSLYRSTDGGANFSQLPNTFSSTINDVDVDASNRLIVSTQSNGVQVSTNDGISFAAVGTGLSATASIITTTVDGNGNIYSMASDGPYRSLDHGTTWAAIKGAITDPFFSGFIDVDASNNLFIVNLSTAKIYVSTNPTTPTASSVSWSAGVSTNVSNSNTIGGVLFQNTTTWYLGRFNTGIDKTTDGGASYTNISSGMKGITNATPKLIITSGGRLLYAFGGIGYQLSIDNGSTWNLINTGNANRSINGFLRLSDGTILAYGFGGIIRTSDQGNTWVQQTATSASSLTTGTGINVYSYNSATISKSTDQGVTLNAMALTGMPASYSIQKVVADTSDNLYIYLFNSSTSTSELWKVASPGLAATKVTAYSGSGIADIAVTGTNLFVVFGAQLFKSTDGGASFTISTLSTGGALIWAVDVNNLYVQGQTAGVFIASVDGGASWTTKTPVDNTVARITDVVLTTSEFLVAATTNSVIQRSSTPVILPKAPTGLTIASKGVQTIDLQWDDNASNETGYQIEFSAGNNSSYQVAVTYNGVFVSPQNKLYATNAVPTDSLVTYFYRVKAVNAAGSSAYSNEVSGTGLKSCTSTIPNNRSWTAVAVADPGSTASGAGPFQNANVLITKTGKNAFTISQYDLGVVPPALRSGVTSAFIQETCGTTYFQNDFSGQDLANGQGTWNGTNTLVIKWQVDPSSYSKFQGTTTFTLNATDPVPSTPTLSTYIFSGTTNYLLWTQSAYATQYVIERSTVSNSFSGPPLTTVNFPAVQYFDAGVTPGTVYYYRVTAKNAAGSSAPSAQSSITPPVSTLFSPVQNSLALNSDNQQGVSWGDLDGDGDEDYIIPSFNTIDGQLTVPVFYENTGSGQFTRRTIAAMAGENTSTYRGAMVMDANNDGKLDVYFTRSSTNTLPDLLLTNNGGWNFTKNPIPVSARASVFRAASGADFDHDGLVDIAIIDTDPTATAVSPIFMKNQSTANTISFSALTNAITSSATIGREVSWADFNNDGYQDLLILFFNSAATVPNPNVPNKLFKNNGDGTFTQVTGTIFDTDIFFGARTSSWGDIDNDGDLDLYIGSQTAAVVDRLYQNNGNGTFTSITGGVVAESGTTTFGSAFGDIDNDGDLDLIAINSANGNSIFINSGNGTFTKYAVGSELLNSTQLNNIGGSFVDYDNNGFLDISTGRNSGNIPPFLYQNSLTASASRNWTEFKLIGTLSNKAAIGARIAVTTTSPARTMIREITSRSGYGSQSSLIQHFGLGSATTISQIKITWPNGGVQTWTNPPAAQTVNQIVTITEDFAGPTFNFAPANGATGVALGNTLALNLNKAGTAVIGKNIVVRKGSPTAVPTQTLAVTSGVSSSGNTVYTYTLAAAFDPLTQYYISIDAGAFIDIFGNVSLAVAPAGWSFITIDNVAPTISFTPPALIDKSKIPTTVFSVTAADNISVGSVVMSYKGLAATTYQTATGTLNAGTGKYDFTLQAAYFDATGMEYYFTVSDGSNNTANSPASGTHITRIDNVAPTITFTPPLNVQKSSIGTTTLSLTAADNFSVASVVMSYRKVTATQYQTLTGVFNATTSKYDFPLQATFFDDMGMEYYFTAKDGSDNATLNPSTGTNILKVAFSATTTALGVSAGSAVGDYKIISIPLDLASSNFANILSNFGAPDPTVWKLLKYQGSPQAWLAYPNGFSSAARGEGYFILSKQGQNLNFDQAVAPAYSQTNLFQLSLSPGFNLIGNPYMLPINWEDSRIAGVGAVKTYQGGNYTDGNTIDVYSGGFVFANAAVTVPVKLKTSVNGGRVAQSVSSQIDGNEWIVPIRMIQDERQFNFGGIGMSPGASLSYDDLDDFAPPSPTGQFEMNFAHPEHFMKNFSRDVVPLVQGYTWTFSATSNLMSPAKLVWNNAEFAGAGQDLYLLDVALQHPINMKTETSYEFSPSISKEFKVFYGADVKDQLKPNHVFLGSVSPNPATGPVTIPFTLPDVGGPMQVHLQVFDMLGRPVESILNQTLPAGFYRVDYDAAAPGGNGMYIIKLAVSYRDNQEVVSTKLIIRK